MNYLQELSTHRLVTTLGWTLLHSLWQGAVIAIALAALLLVLHRHSSTVRYAVASIAMCTMLLASMATFFSVYHTTFTTTIKPEDNDHMVSLIAAGFPVELFHSIEPGHRIALPESVSFANYFHQHLPLMVLVWMLGSMVLMLRLLGGLAYTQRLKSYKTQPLPAYWQQKMQHLCAKIRISQPVRLVESALVQVPMVIGYLKPVILLPIGTITHLPAEQVEAILAHELAHIYRKDYLINIIQSIIEILFFYHPAIWWISGRVREEREHCCDDIALNVCHDSVTFARALAQLEEKQISIPGMAMAFTGRSRRLLHRIQRMLSHPRQHPTFSEGFIAASVLAGSILLITVSANAHRNWQPKEHQSSTSASISESVQEVSSSMELPNTLLADDANAYEALTLQITDTTNRKVDLIIVKNRKGRVVELYVDGKKIPRNRIDDFWPMIKEALEAENNPIVSTDIAADQQKTRRALQKIDHTDGFYYEFWQDDSYPDFDVNVDVDMDIAPLPPIAPVAPIAPLAPLPPMPDTEDEDEAMMAHEEAMWDHEEAMREFEREMAEFSREMERQDRELARQLRDLEFTSEEERERGIRNLERQRAEHERNREQWRRNIEERNRQREREREQHVRDINRQREQLLRQRERDREETLRQRERAFQERENARIRAEQGREAAMIKREEANRKRELFQKALRNELKKDGLIENEQNYSFKINDSGLYVDGKKQPDAVFEKYKRLIEKETGKPFSGNSWHFQYSITD